MEPLPYYKWHWRDYRANRRVQRMSWQAKGLYRELLDEFWAEGCLPLDHAALADICGCTVEEFSKLWPEMEGCWEVTDGGLVNAKMDSMRTDLDSLRVKRAKSGKAGAIAKQVSASAEENQADAEQVSASAKQVLASASKCHIAEQSRAEQSKEEKKPAAAKVQELESFQIPDWVEQDTWDVYMEVRRASKNAKNTPRALRMVIKQLDAFRVEGYNPNTILETSIRSGWVDVYKPKEPPPKPKVVYREMTEEEAAAAWKRDFGVN